MTSLAVITRFSIQFLSMLFNFLKLAYHSFKWFINFLTYHPFDSLCVQHHHHHHHLQPLHQEFHQMVAEEDGVEIWRNPREGGEGEGEEEVDCAVCLNKVSEGEEVRVLRCAHVFHRPCLNQWVALRNFTCPLCRDFLLGSAIRSSVNGEGGETHVLFFKFSSFSDNNNSERDNWWLR